MKNPGKHMLGALALSLVLTLGGLARAQSQGAGTDAAVETLRAEVVGKGWLLFSAKTEKGDYDLFLSRPDGSNKRHFTQTQEWSEYGGRFSADGNRVLYRRQKKGPELRPGEGISHDTWGATGTLVMANADGSNPQPQGNDGEFPWASWSPDGRQIACLYRREGRIRIFDLETKKPVKELPRQGMFQQMFWSGDGKRLCSTANLNGQNWNVVSLEIETGQTTQVSRNLSCTPDWFQHDANRVIYSSRTPGLGSDYGWTLLMQGTADGKSRSLIYGQLGRHIYYGGTSPDDKYAVFAAPESDGGTDAEMVIVRLADAPIVVPDDFKQLKALYPNARSGPAVRLKQAGFEPHWTYAEVGGK